MTEFESPPFHPREVHFEHIPFNWKLWSVGAACIVAAISFVLAYLVLKPAKTVHTPPANVQWLEGMVPMTPDGQSVTFVYAQLGWDRSTGYLVARPVRPAEQP